jgi:KaiC/GvpD/RAD55 family RecA-like ATPase
MSNVDTARLWCERNLPCGGSLLRDGDTWLCRSPLREDTSPSFSVSIGKRTYHDFGDGASGTLTELAELMGVDAPEWEGDFRERKEPSSARAGDSSSDAVKLWGSGKTAGDDHPYLVRKGVKPNGCREATVNGERTLLVPAFDDSRRVVGCERIKPDGSKKHAGTKAGAFFFLGGVEDGKPVVLTEGFSTGASIHECTGYPAVVCFGSTNVPTIARRLREKRPGVELVAATDNDDAGRKAAEGCPAGTFAVIPDGAEKTDWNDVFKLMGADETRKLFDKKLEAAREKAPLPKKDALSLLCGPSPDRAVSPENIWLFPRGHVSVVASDPGAGKSMLLANVAADLSRGGKIIGGREEPARTVLYLNGEAGRALFDSRFRLAGWSFDSTRLRVVHLEDAQTREIALELDTEIGRDTIRRLVESVMPDVLIVDSLVAFFGGDQNEAQSVRDVVVFLKTLAAKHNMAVCVIHHLRKRGIRDTSVEVTQSEVQGSNAILKLVSLVAGIETRKDDDDETTIRVVRPLKTWVRPFAPFTFRFEDGDDDSFRLVFDHDPALPGDRGKRGAWEILSRAFGHGEPFTRASVEEICGVSDGLARRYLRDWFSSGKLTREGKNRATEYRVVSSSRGLQSASPDTPKKSTVKRDYSVIATIPDGTGGTVKVPSKYRQNRGDSEKPVIATIPDGTFTSTGSDCCSATVSTFDGTFSGCTGKGNTPDESIVVLPKTETDFPSHGKNSASLPGPLVEVDTFPDDMELPYEWPGHGWIVRVNRTGNGERSFGVAATRDGKPKGWLREPKRALSGVSACA